MYGDCMADTDERYTPAWVLDVVRSYAPIACDPCTTRDNRVGADTYYALPDDGLHSAWRPKADGVVWVNPPYSRGQLPRWVDRMVTAAVVDDSEIIALLPSDLGSRAGQRVAASADALCFIAGRLVFDGPPGYDVRTGAKQPSILAYWGERSKKFAAHFAQIGVTWKR